MVVTAERDIEGVLAAAQCVVHTHERLAEYLHAGLTLAEIDTYVERVLEDLDCKSAFLRYRIAGHPPWQDSTLSFSLEDRQGETLLRFVQEFAQELSDETYGTYNFTWGYDLYSLQLLCETGTGTPFVPPSD